MSTNVIIALVPHSKALNLFVLEESIKRHILTFRTFLSDLFLVFFLNVLRNTFCNFANTFLFLKKICILFLQLKLFLIIYLNDLYILQKYNLNDIILQITIFTGPR